MPLESKFFWKMGGVAALLVLFAQGVAVVAAPYFFTSVRDSHSLGYTRFLGGPAINDDGIVAYIAVLSNQVRVESSGSTLGQSVDLTQAAFSNPVLAGGAVNPYVAVQRTQQSPAVVIMQSHLTHHITTNGPLSDFGAPAINNVGAVAFYADLDNGGQGIYVDFGDFSDQLTIANSEGLFRSFGKTVSLDNSGNVAFSASVNELHTILLAANSSDFGLVADSSGPLKTLSSPSLNEKGIVAFRAELDNGGSGVFTSSVGGPVVTIAESGGRLSEFARPVINDGGAVAFSALFDTLDIGIFTGADVLNEKVIKQGDPLFGSVVTELEFDRGMNNHGQLAFRYVLANGVEGIAVATPIPEATTGVLALMGLTIAACRRR